MRAICGHGRTRSAKSPSSTASRVGRKRPPAARAHEQLIRRGTERLEQIAGADQLGRRAAADADLDREQAVEDQQPGALPRGLEPRREVARADRDLEHPGGRELPGGDPRADVEFLGQLVVGVEQVGVERDRLRLVRHQVRMAAPPQRSGLDSPSVFDGNVTPLSTLDLPTPSPVYASRIEPHTTSDVRW